METRANNAIAPIANNDCMLPISNTQFFNVGG
jgi:hypothetical protein